MSRSIPAVVTTALFFSVSGLADAEENAPSDKIWNELISMTLQDLVNVNVTSAAKRPQKISEAPSPIYVFTEEDIKRTGARSIMELVKFIPGFYIYPRLDQTFVIASRGVRSSSNDKILFLIDGIPLNNIAQSGAANVHIFPGLDKVKRVEIISGPGSTLWGSDASQAVISIITKDGKDVDGTFANVNLATVDNNTELNYLSGGEFSEGQYMFSITYAQSDGFGDERNGYKNYVHDFDTVPWNDQHANFNALYPSYEIYGKISINDYTIKALASEKAIYSFWGTTTVTDWSDKLDKQAIITSKDMQIELSHLKTISDDKTLETKFSAKQIDYVRDEEVEVGTDHGSRFDDPTIEPIDNSAHFPEAGFGLESQLNWDVNKSNKLVTGGRVRVTNAGGAEIDYLNLTTGQTQDNANAKDSMYYRRTRDTVVGIYADNTYAATDRLTLIGGARVDYNEPREPVSIISPRGAAIYKITDKVTGKYMYNTGYVRPQMGKSYKVSLSKQGAVKESEKIRAHDIILAYNTLDTQFSIDTYYMTTYDRNRYDALQAAFVDSGNITTQGVDVLFKQSLMDGKILLDFNYGYARAKIEDEFGNKSSYLEGIPTHVYAAGVAYNFTPKVSLYTNVNGWRELKMDHARATSWIDTGTHPDSYQGDYLVDMNLRFMDLYDDTLDVSFYVLNVFDRQARLQAKDDWYSWWSYARGRSIGTKISWKF